MKRHKLIQRLTAALVAGAMALSLCAPALAAADEPAAALQPCAGVYLTRIFLDGQWRPAATGIGKRPTVDSSADAAVTCETFVPDFTGNVYGQQPVLEFYKYFCPVRKFNSLIELAALIHHAADESKAYFVGVNATK